MIHRRGLPTWLAVDEQSLDHAGWQSASLLAKVFLCASDALHLTRAKEHGFRKIYSNDQHFLADSMHFGLKGANVVQ
jgi:predicted nucleic acid-binding protein